jgi:hypothetical protein
MLTISRLPDIQRKELCKSMKRWKQSKSAVDEVDATRIEAMDYTTASTWAGYFVSRVQRCGIENESIVAVVAGNIDDRIVFGVLLALPGIPPKRLLCEHQCQVVWDTLPLAL